MRSRSGAWVTPASVGIVLLAVTFHLGRNQRVDGGWRDVAQPAPPEADFAVPGWIKVQGSVEVVAFQDFGAHDLTRPAIVKGSPAASWPARKRWDAEYLAARLGELKMVRMTKDRNPKFMYEDNRLLLRLWDEAAEVIPPSNYERANLSAHDFFFPTEGDRPMYYSQPLDPLYHGAIEADAAPRGFLAVANGGREASTNIWISRVGVVAGLHYDLTHNMFAQVAGCKRFVLTPVHELTRSKLFPRDHPNDRQSQLEIEGVAERLGVVLNATVADLGPGDVLYLPPSVGHRVAAFPCSAGNLSVSLNTWTASADHDVYRAKENAERIPERFRAAKVEAGQARMRLRALGPYLHHVTQALLPSKTLAELAAATVAERHLPQPELAAGLGCEPFAPERCPAHVTDLGDLGATEPAIASAIAGEARATAADFYAAGFASLHPAVRELQLHDFLERVVTAAVGVPHLCPLLRCLAQAAVPR